ncbi:MAG TPA: hypothetical protein VD905_06145 [Flavobacteriales bacterium]|nr:hypothetical protein [Flavobacteriales bacterium]
MVEVFKTTIEDTGQANEVMERLRFHMPKANISIDLEDCDKVLRIEDNSISTDVVFSVFNDLSHGCKQLL